MTNAQSLPNARYGEEQQHRRENAAEVRMDDTQLFHDGAYASYGFDVDVSDFCKKIVKLCYIDLEVHKETQAAAEMAEE